MKEAEVVKLLVVEDDPSLRQAIVAILQDEDYSVDQAETGDVGLWMAESSNYDLLVLDLMLPVMDGIILLKTLRSKGVQTPALFLTAKDSVESRVKGLDAGADDYIVKPFAAEELLARIRVIFRRMGLFANEGEFSYGGITLSDKEHEGYIQQQPLKLTTKEYELLEYLLRNRMQILTRAQIYDRVWGIDSDTSEGIVDLYIHYLRKKLAGFQMDPWIKTIRGVGYMLKETTEHV